MTPEQGGFLGYPGLHPIREAQGSYQAWEAILDADKEHEKHLETPEGRFQAALNIIKNGAMVIELASLSDAEFRRYSLVNARAKEITGSNICATYSTFAHLVLTIGKVGAAAKSDTDEKDWQRTAFGNELLPISVYLWQKMIDLGINPARALSSTSHTKKDEQGNIADSSPYARAMILVDTYIHKQVNKRDLAERRKLDGSSIQKHLENLKVEGLVSFESADNVGPYIKFSTEKSTVDLDTWPGYVTPRGNAYKKASHFVRMAIKSIMENGRDVFTAQDIIDVVEKDFPEAVQGAKDYSLVLRILSFDVREKRLQRLRGFTKENMSNITLCEKGVAFVEEVLMPLELWSRNPNSVPHVNDIRNRLRINPESQNQVLASVAGVYLETSPNKHGDIQAKISEGERLIEQHPDINQADLARLMGVSVKTAGRIVRSLIASNVVSLRAGKMGRKYYSIKAS